MNNFDEDKNQLNEKSSIKLVKYLLTINKAYKESIDDKLTSLKQILESNRKQQKELNIQIQNNFNKTSKTISNNKSSIDNEKNKSENEIVKIRLNYFKDRFGSEPDQNIDTIQKSNFIIRDYVPQCKSEWTLVYREKLKHAVINDSLRILKLPISTRVAFLEEKLFDLIKTQSYSNIDLKTIRKQKRTASKLEEKFDNYEANDILNKVDPNRLDWMKISKLDIGGIFSSNECFLVWTNVCHPRINQLKWASNEDKFLIDLARKYKEKNWERIALELNTNRSAFLCIKRYHEKTADKYCKRDWSENESNELCKLAEQHRIGLYVPYNYLCYLNGTRDRNNIYNLHLKVDPNLNHGKWSQSEEQAFEEALQFYNTVYNWQEISEYIGTRTSFQCKDRYELKYCNPEKYINWTREEDKKLIESYKKFENQWVKIATYVFPHRNDNACLHRYTKLMNWHQQNIWFEKQPDEIKEFILFLCKRNKKDLNEQILLTEDGEIVPKRPIFSQNLGNIINTIYEKKDLVYEFVSKMRQGQLSLTILNKIGVYTHALNMIIKRYQKNHNQSLKPLENIKKIKARFSALKNLKKLKKESNSIETIKKYTRKKKKISDDDSNDKINKKRKHIKDLLSETLNSDGISSGEQFTISKSLNNKLKEYNSIKNKYKKKSLKISELINLNKIDGIEMNNTYLETNFDTNLSSNNETIINKQIKKRGRPSHNRINQNEPKVKKLKNTHLIQNDNNLVLKEIEIKKLTNELNNDNSIIIQFDSIPDGIKIPCLTEQSSLFKFMYSLRKEENNSKYFFKYSIINLNGKYVAIKPYNGTVTQEYLNEKRLKAIEQVLKPVLNALNKI